MADFYQRVFQMHRSDHGKIDAHGLRAELAFLTGDPEEHHQLVFLAGKPKDLTFNVINQISFRVGELADLRTYWHFLQKEPNASDIYAFSHGNAWSLYFHDPEGNRCEIYLDTPWYVEQPFRARGSSSNAPLAPAVVGQGEIWLVQPQLPWPALPIISSLLVGPIHDHDRK